ncbi:hypothetical protein KIN20_020634 [Parelaphostrongylus tenuis]|uniref:Uncharacterized protein n=1 Tax=Parelaphostrongylus tenuis TaxID=148309 RepID=A0AAD5N9Z4_PARTN|nr:hypothetical protein KIN20_020634 [Parelaphostrongylus tenuis]
MVGSSLDGEEKGEKMHNGTSKRSNTPTDDSESVNTQKIKSSNDTGAVVSEKRRPGRPPGKREKSKSDGKWSSCSTQNGGRFTLPLTVPDSWPTVTNMEEIMKEISEIYGNVKEEKRGEFHSQIKAFVFALLWEDGSFATS